MKQWLHDFLAIHGWSASLQGGCRRRRRLGMPGMRKNEGPAGGRTVTVSENPRRQRRAQGAPPWRCRLRFSISCPVRALAGPSKSGRYGRYTAGPRILFSLHTISWARRGGPPASGGAGRGSGLGDGRARPPRPRVRPPASPSGRKKRYNHVHISYLYVNTNSGRRRVKKG